MPDWIDRIARWSARSDEGPAQAGARRLELALDREVSRRGVLKTAALASVGGAAAGKLATGALAGDSACQQGSLDRCLSKSVMKVDIAGMLCRFEPPSRREACREAARTERDTLTTTCLRTYCTCPEGQEPCAAVGVRGICCPAGQVCQIDANGASCVEPSAGAGSRPPRPGPCQEDPPTADSLFAASAALAGGANQAALSPGGCMQYQRERNGAEIVAERITGGGTLVAEYTYSAAGATGRQDFDGDGFFEWRGTVTNGSNPEIAVEILEYDQYTQQLTRRRTREQRGSTVHHVWQLDYGQGLTTIREFDAPADQASDLEAPRVSAAQGGGPKAEFGWFGCDDAEKARLTKGLEDCMKQVLPCLDEHKHTAVKNEMAKMFAGNTKFNCVTSGPKGVNRGTTKHPMSTDTKIDINTEKLGQVSDRSLVCHELFHGTSLGEHDEYLIQNPFNLSDSQEADKVDSCTVLCFSPDFANQCHCATCLGTDVCDERCKKYKKCPSCEKGICPCEVGQIYYESLTRCHEKCPAGLKCFAKQCRPLSVCCKK